MNSGNQSGPRLNNPFGGTPGNDPFLHSQDLPSRNRTPVPSGDLLQVSLRVLQYFDILIYYSIRSLLLERRPSDFARTRVRSVREAALGAAPRRRRRLHRATTDHRVLMLRRWCRLSTRTQLFRVSVMRTPVLTHLPARRMGAAAAAVATACVSSLILFSRCF